MKVSLQEERGNGLDEQGILFLCGEIADATSEAVCRQIIELNIRGQVEQIQMIINSPGGACAAGFAIIDLMEWSRIPIYTAGIGMIASIALLVFMTGQRGRRVITPRTSILSHRFSAITAGNHSQLLARRKELDLEHTRIVEHYLRYSAVQDVRELEACLLRDVDTWLSAEEAIRYGLADLVEPLGCERRSA